MGSAGGAGPRQLPVGAGARPARGGAPVARTWCRKAQECSESKSHQKASFYCVPGRFEGADGTSARRWAQRRWRSSNAQEEWKGTKTLENAAELETSNGVRILCAF